MPAPLLSDTSALGRDYVDTETGQPYQLYEVQFFVWADDGIWVPDGPEWPPVSGETYAGWDFAEEQVSRCKLLVGAPESMGLDRTLPPTVPLSDMVPVDFSVNPEEPHPYSWRHQLRVYNQAQFVQTGERYAGLILVEMVGGSKMVERFTVQK